MAAGVISWRNGSGWRSSWRHAGSIISWLAMAAGSGKHQLSACIIISGSISCLASAAIGTSSAMAKASASAWRKHGNVA